MPGQPGARLFADVVDIYLDQSQLVATGNVAFTTAEGRIGAERVEFNFRDGTATFTQAAGIMSVGEFADRAAFGGQDPDVYFWGDRIEKVGPKNYRITDGGFTACVQPTPRWEVSSKTITLNLDDYAVARGTVLRVKGVPRDFRPVVAPRCRLINRRGHASRCTRWPTHSNSKRGGPTMELTTLSPVRRTALSWIGGLALLAMAPLASAVPPSFSGTITAPIPAIGGNVIINLRQQNVVDGSAPVAITTGQGVVLLNGQFSPPSGLEIAPFDADPTSFGTVCVRITNVSYRTEIVGTLSAQLSGTNALGETGGTGLPGITITNAAGP